MSAAMKAMGDKAPGAIESDAIKIAQRILEEDRDPTPEEGEIIIRARRDGTEVQKVTLEALLDLSERQANFRARAATAAIAIETSNRRRDHQLQRPVRWAQMHEIQKLLHVLAEGLAYPQQAHFLRVAQQIRDGFYAGPIPDTFESDRIPR